MINSVEEANRAIQAGELGNVDNPDDLRRAEGYIAALKGPETQGLIDALQTMARNQQESGTTLFIAEKAVSKFLDGIK